MSQTEAPEPQRMPGGRGNHQGRIPGREDIGMGLKWKPDREVASTRTPHPRPHWAPPSLAWPPLIPLSMPSQLPPCWLNCGHRLLGLHPLHRDGGREWGEAWPQRHPTPHPSFPLLSPLSPPGMKKWDVPRAPHHFMGHASSLPLPMRLPHRPRPRLNLSH